MRPDVVAIDGEIKPWGTPRLRDVAGVQFRVSEMPFETMQRRGHPHPECRFYPEYVCRAIDELKWLRFEAGGERYYREHADRKSVV